MEDWSKSLDNGSKSRYIDPASQTNATVFVRARLAWSLAPPAETVQLPLEVQKMYETMNDNERISSTTSVLQLTLLPKIKHPIKPANDEDF